MKRLISAFAVMLCMISTALCASIEIKGATFTARQLTSDATDGNVVFNTASNMQVWCNRTAPRWVSIYPSYTAQQQRTMYNENIISVTSGGSSAITVAQVSPQQSNLNYVMNGTLGNMNANSKNITEYTNNYSNSSTFWRQWAQSLYPKYGYSANADYRGYGGWVTGNTINGPSSLTLSIHTGTESYEIYSGTQNFIATADYSPLTSWSDYYYYCKLCGGQLSGHESNSVLHFGQERADGTAGVPNGFIMYRSSLQYQNDNLFVQTVREFVKDTTAHQVSRTYYQFQSSGINSGTITSSISNGTLGLNSNHIKQKKNKPDTFRIRLIYYLHTL